MILPLENLAKELFCAGFGFLDKKASDRTFDSSLDYKDFCIDLAKYVKRLEIKARIDEVTMAGQGDFWQERRVNELMKSLKELTEQGLVKARG